MLGTSPRNPKPEDEDKASAFVNSSYGFSHVRQMRHTVEFLYC